MSTPNAIRLGTIENRIIEAENHYSDDYDMFPGVVQMNFIDYALLDIIRKQNAIIVDLEVRLTKLELFTGFVEETSGLTTFAGSVDYGDGPEGAQLGTDGELMF